MLRQRRYLLGVWLALLCALFFTMPAWAVQMQSGDTVSVPQGKISGPLFVSGNYVVINADVTGDVFAAGQSVVLNGKVDGDFIGAGQTVRVNGSVNGNVRTAANQVEINGQVERSVTAISSSINIGSGARINQDALLFGNNLQVACPVQGQVLGSGNEIRLEGPVGGDVRIWGVQNLSLGPAAVIGGTLTYTSNSQADISPQAKVNQVSRLQPQPKEVKNPRQDGFSWVEELTCFLAGLLLWAVIYLLFPRFLPNMGRVVESSPGPTLGWGFLSILVAPLAGLILLITVIGIPLAIILFVLYALILLTAKITVGDVLGRFLSRRFNWEGRVPFTLSFIGAFLALILLSKIPVVGFFINLIVCSLAFGMVVLYYFHRHKRKPQDIETIIQE
ncbi:MAG TPA: hypothetical protein VN426_10805 [Syntrophomonadaceae bacterium]|nr:hypothetical protein [Syntrophomonadaceae bacterium]